MDGIEEFSSAHPLLLIGCGKMGGALLEGWLEAGLDPEFVLIVDPAALQTVPDVIPRENLVNDVTRLGRDIKPRMVIMAVKPQMMPGVLDGLADWQELDAVVLSIAAGTRIETIREGFGKGAHVIRAMPNTPASVGAGITAIYAGAEVSHADATLAENLLSATGKTVWIHDEDLIDSVTGVSGSGPAYVFHLVEAMAAGGAAAGLDEETAMILARETIIGAGALLAQSDESARKLRENVTSPNGTTQAALDVLMADDGLARLMRRAIIAATERGRELSK